MEIKPYFADIWGTKETRCSALIAQTIILSEKFREFIANQLDISKDELSIQKIKTEHSFGNDNGRIDIYLRCSNGLLVGIENKKWHFLHNDQLIGYYHALKKECNNFRLVFLVPSLYRRLSEHEKPNGLIRINYKDIIIWLENQNFQESFEKKYFENLSSYLHALEIEMKPLNTKDIDCLINWNTVDSKLHAILSIVRQSSKGSKILRSSGHIYYIIKNYKFPIYVGFRYSKLGFYDDELLNDKPECLIYIYDDWDNPEEIEKNHIVKTIHDTITHKYQNIDTQMKFYPRKIKNECRLSIRKSIADFDGKELEEIVKWFNENLDILRQSVAEI